jgi:hypothetical protein
VGELVLLIGGLALLLSPRLRAAFAAPLLQLWGVVALWGLVRTLPYVSQYGVMALRDAVIWAYGVFAVLVAAFVSDTERLHLVLRQVARWVPRYILWVPVLAALPMYLHDYLPTPVPDATLPTFKPGDVAVHLAGAGTCLLLGLHRSGDHGREPRLSALSEQVLWAVWAVGCLVVASVNRSGTLALILSIALVLAFRGPLVFGRLLKLAAVVLILVVGAFTSEVSLGRYTSRSVSTEQIAKNLGSIVGRRDNGGLDGTREWRMEWWRRIVHETVFGDKFWTGRGFGASLADDAFFQIDESLRSPHNGHMSILAREGVPGLVLWATLQFAFAASLVRAYHRARVRGHDAWARLDLWILAYWLAFMVNITFDVYLEGPQGGIWFWSLFGFGVAVLRTQARVLAPPVRRTLQLHRSNGGAPVSAAGGRA